MKKLLFLCLVGTFAMTSPTLFAQEKAPLGVGNLALKGDYIEFTEDDFEDLDIDTGMYIGVEGFHEVSPNVYLGAEIGYAVDMDGEADIHLFEADVDLTYIPVEVNVKYATELSPSLVFDFGAGVSYNYAEIEISNGDSDSEDEWLFGGQFFADLNYTFDTFFLGLNGKYQITEEGDDLDVSFDNWRIGGQIGFFF